MPARTIAVTATSFKANASLMAELKSALPSWKVISDGSFSDLLESASYLLVGREKIDATTLKPHHKAIVKYGVGLDNIDLKACENAGVPVYSAPGVNRDEVVEQTLGLMIGLTRNLFYSNQEVHSQIWNKNGGRSLSELTVGIIGAGNIGTRLTEVLAKTFRPKILICDILDKSHLSTHFNAQQVDFEECLRSSDILTFHVPLTDGTREMFNRNSLDNVKPGCFVINTSRGEVICDATLLQGLEKKIIRGAALDVFTEEPLPLESPLRSRPEIILTPHIAGNSGAAVLKMGRAAIQLLVTVTS